MMIGVPSSPMNLVCGELRHAARTRFVVWGFLHPWHVRKCLHQFRNSKCVNLCCSTSAPLGNTGTFPGLAGCATSAVSCSKPINTLTPPVSDFIFALVSALSRYTPPARSNSMRLPVNSLSTVPTAERDDVASVTHLSNRYD